MLKALFVIELVALLYALTVVFSCSSARGEAMDDLVLGALGVNGPIAVLKYENFENSKAECELDGEVHSVCPNPNVIGIRGDEGSDRKRERNLR